MSENEKLKFSLTVMVNKEKPKVLFAEADGDFVDVLLSFLTLPLGKIVTVLKKHYGDQAPVFGSLNTLCKSIAKLNSAYFWTKRGKQKLVHPKSRFEAKCKRLDNDYHYDDDGDVAQPTEYDSCCYYRMSFISMYSDAATCKYCGRTINKENGVKDNSKGAANSDTMYFVISDELRIFPSTKGRSQTISILGITDTDGAYIMNNVCFGFREIMDLLQSSLLSETPLSDVILGRKITTTNSRLCRPKHGISYHQIEKEATSKFKKMIIKIVIQKSSGKLLFAKVEEDFIDFISTFLTICLGGVECLLDSTISLTCIDNLCGSIANIISNKNSITGRLLPLSEECLSQFYEDMFWFSSSRFPSGQGYHIKGPIIYQVTDDLTVTPFCMALFIANLTRLGIPISDVKELEMHIGLKEGLNILKASLTSTCALTNGLDLMNYVVMKQVKQEH